MNHSMRRIDRCLSEDAARTVLADGEYGILSTMGSDGYPYGVPVNYVLSDDKLYFHCAKDEGHKQENLTFCSRVCFTVIGSAQLVPADFTERYQSVIVFGTARKLTSEEEKKEMLFKLIEKYAPNHLEKSRRYVTASSGVTDIFEISIEEITGKANR